MTSVSLCHVSAKCPEPDCKYEAHQFDPSSARDHAVEVVTAAMNAHLEAEHPGSGEVVE